MDSMITVIVRLGTGRGAKSCPSSHDAPSISKGSQAKGSVHWHARGPHVHLRGIEAMKCANQRHTRRPAGDLVYVQRWVSDM